MKTCSDIKKRLCLLLCRNKSLTIGQELREYLRTQDFGNTKKNHFKYKLIHLIILFIFIVIINCNALQLSMYPGEINFIGKPNETICQRIILNSDKETVLISKILWLNNKNYLKQLEKYNKNSIDLFIENNFLENLDINKTQETEICLKFQKTGKYNGAIVYSANEGYAGIGSWISADITPIKQENKITGSFVNIAFNNPIKNSLSRPLIIMTALLIITLLILIIIRKKSR